MKFACASCGKVDHHDDPKCGTCGGSVLQKDGAVEGKNAILDAEVREIKREIGSLRRSTRAANARLDELQRRLEQLTTGHAS